MTAPSRQPLNDTDGHAGTLAAGRRVLDLESRALAALSAGLDAGFGRTVAILHAAAGRVVVTGMGKSGHIARKIAGTLASTGTPALFVHPAEASHGDLGMIAPGDVVIALSNSGETPELRDLLAYTRRHAIPLVAITARAGSTLDQTADVSLILPPEPEACSIGLAPTTSTTMMLALGDALAVALMERKGFTADRFQVFHPGGKLGARLVRVRDIMHGPDDLPLAAAEATMAEVLLVMTAGRFGCAGVLAGDGTLAGIVTDGDLRRHMTADLLARRADEVMTRNPLAIRGEALAAEALGTMNERRITCLFVVADGRPEGIVHIHDCLRAGVA